MKSFSYLLGGLLLGALLALVVTAFGAETIHSCTESDGSVTYTNKAGQYRFCSPTKLTRELSIAPERKDYAPLTTIPESTPHAPDKPISSVNDRLCSLYNDWMTLTSRTKGGFYHNTVEDVQMRLELVQLFGGGFVPNSCR